MLKKNKVIRLVAVFAITAVMLVGSPYMSSFKSAAASVSSLQEQKKELQQKAAALEKKKKSLSSDLSNQKQKKRMIEDQIAVKEEEIAVNDQLIYSVDQDIKKNEEAIKNEEGEILNKQMAIQDRFSSLQERLRLVAKTGNVSVLQMLFDTDNYVDFLLKRKLMEVMSHNDEKLIEELEKEIEKINKDKAELEKKKADLNDQKTLLVSIRDEADKDKEDLEVLYDEAASIANSIQGDIDDTEKQLAHTKEQEAALEAEIQDILRRSNNSNGSAYKGGRMYWPSTSCKIVTDVYGWRMLSGSSNFHKGIDIACSGSAYGKDIIAADDGIVIYANKSDSWGSGYGYYVMVDHGVSSSGSRIVTLYAHMSSVYVYEGQRVYGGETQIGAIGSTGWSYGSHLHFEVRVDGSPVDPLGGYVAIP